MATEPYRHKSEVILDVARDLQVAGGKPTGADIASRAGVSKQRVYYWLDQLELQGRVRLARDTRGRLIPGGITIL